MIEIGQACDHPLEMVGRHRVCRICAAVYAAVAGPREVVLLGQYAAVLALLEEYAALAARQAAPEGAREAKLEALLRRSLNYFEWYEDHGYSSQRGLVSDIVDAIGRQAKIDPALTPDPAS